VFIPQCVEDLFFVTQRTVDRSLGTDSAAIAMSMGNHIVALVDRFQEARVYSLLASNKVFYKCKSKNEIRLPWCKAANGEMAASSSSSALFEIGASSASSSSAPPMTMTSSEAEIVESTVGGSAAADIGAELAELMVNKFQTSGLAGIASASFAGVNSWLMNFTAEGGPGLVAPEPQQAAAANSRPNSMTPNRSSSAPSSGSGLSTTPAVKAPTPTPLKFDELLIQALEEEVQETLLTSGSDFDEELLLGLEDNCIKLSSVAVSASSLDNLIGKFSSLVENARHSYLGEKEKSQLGALSIIIQELTRCRQDYRNMLQECAQLIVYTAFNSDLEGKLRVLLSRFAEYCNLCLLCLTDM
jgi:hypothetical protein